MSTSVKKYLEKQRYKKYLKTKEKQNPKKGKKKKIKSISERKKKYLDYLKSDEWAQLKIDLFNHRGYKCERCWKTNKLHIHHKTYDNLFNEEPEDLEILCQKCHRLEHKKSKP